MEFQDPQQFQTEIAEPQHLTNQQTPPNQQETVLGEEEIEPRKKLWEKHQKELLNIQSLIEKTQKEIKQNEKKVKDCNLLINMLNNRKKRTLELYSYKTKENDIIKRIRM